jgi:organic radical activating enzyme|tara:strand:+ start:526 stop:1971 length:1446 start_codon:yes stop_codon:yes gene_type:complete
MTEEKNRLIEVNKKINKVGPGFCLAKWTQVTIHLQTGRTHSCHHPTTHKIPLAEIKRNPSALHNTRFKKQKRKEMLEGERPSECDYCWRIEDNSQEFSDRTYKSSEPWSEPYLEEIKNLGWRDNFNPKYVEVAFSNACNFKCSYCGPQYSSKWVEELTKHGAYPTTDSFNNIDNLKRDGEMPFNHKDDNPYVEAFWKWWPDLYRDLDTFRITGGEPLLNPNTWKILDYIIENDNPNTNLKLAINSNLGVPDALVNKFIEKIKIIENNSKVREISIFTSCDTADEQAEYVRTGLNYGEWKINVEKMLKATTKTSLVVMSTFNAMSLFKYKQLMDFVYEMKKEYNNPNRYWITALTLDSSYLRYPRHQTVKILPKEYAAIVDELAEYAQDRDTIKPHAFIDKWENWLVGFTEIEASKIKRIADWMRSNEPNGDLETNRYNFYKHFQSHDERRGTDFTTTYPELADFYEECGKIKINNTWRKLV